MPSTLKVRVDAAAVSRQLRALADDLDRPIRQVLRHAVEDIVDLSRSYMRKGFRGGSWPTSSAARDFPGLIAGYYDSSVALVSATVWSTHPAAPVWEWGGDIHPASGAAHWIFKAHPGMAEAMGHQVIHIPRLQPVTRAGEQHLPVIEREMDDALTSLIVEYGF